MDLLHGYNIGKVKMIAEGGIPIGGDLPFSRHTSVAELLLSWTGTGRILNLPP